MKKLLVLAIVAALAISMTACAGNTQTTSSSAAASLTTAATTAATEAETTAKAAATGEDVEIILPAAIFSAVTDEELESMVSQKGYLSATKNEDGSVTLKMTAEVHQAVLDEINTTMKEQLNSDTISAAATYVTDIEYNDDLTKVTIKVNKADYEAAVASGTEAAALTIGTIVSTLQPFLGKDLTSEVSIVDESNDAVLKTYVFPEDMSKIMQELIGAAMAAGGDATASTSAS